MSPASASPRCRAFTMAELLVVVGVIVLLMAVLLPAVGRARRAAARVACAAALRQYALANQMYVQEYRDRYVPAKWGFNPNPTPPWPPPPAGLPAPTVPHQSWVGNMGYRRYLGLKASGSRAPYGLVCPRAVLAHNGANRNGYEIARSYGYNTTGLSWYAGPTVYYTGFRRAEVRSPATKLMFVDATDGTVSQAGSSRYETLGEDWGPPVPVPRTNITAYRHEKGANVVFWDGHAEWLPKGNVINNSRLWRVAR